MIKKTSPNRRPFWVAFFLLITLFSIIMVFQKKNDPSNSMLKLLETGRPYYYQAERVPITRMGDLPIVPVSINGSPALPFLLSTGAGVCLIDDDIGKQLGLPQITSHALLQEAAENGHSLKLWQCDAFTVGAATVTGIPVMLNNMDWTHRQFGTFIAGFIGYNFLSEFMTLLDFPQNQVGFYHSLAQLDADSDFASEDGVTLKMLADAVHPRHLFVNGIFCNREVKFAMDTGYAGGALLRAEKETFPCVRLSEKSDFSYTGEMQFHGLEQLIIPVDFTGRVNGNPKMPQASLLGMKVWSQYRIILDYKSKTVTLHP
ncbi:aspartyl protease family protein [bacterium]|nr:aspartyl protease family protein [bacterium]